MNTIRFQDCTPDIWNHYCKLLVNVTPRHRFEFLSYLTKSFSVKNESVLAFDEHKNFIGLIPLFFEAWSIDGGMGIFSQSAGGGPTPQPLTSTAGSASQYRKRFSSIFDYVDQACQSNGAKRSIFRSDFFTSFDVGRTERQSGQFEPLLAGYNPICVNSLNIDLFLSDEMLMGNVSKFHRRHIRTAQRDGQKVGFVDQKSSASKIEECFAGYQRAHFLAAGRVTRPQASFDAMRELISKGGAALFVNELSGLPISYLFCGSWGQLAFGWSQANIPEFVKEHSPRHLLEWEAINYYKRNGFRYYELGQRYCNGQFSFFADQKLINISIFKERFGGISVPEVQFEKYFDVEIAKLVFTRRNEEFLAENFKCSLQTDSECD